MDCRNSSAPPNLPFWKNERRQKRCVFTEHEQRDKYVWYVPNSGAWLIRINSTKSVTVFQRPDECHCPWHCRPSLQIKRNLNQDECHVMRYIEFIEYETVFYVFEIIKCLCGDEVQRGGFLKVCDRILELNIYRRGARIAFGSFNFPFLELKTIVSVLSMCELIETCCIRTGWAAFGYSCKKVKLYLTICN